MTNCTTCGRKIWREINGQWLHWWTSQEDARTTAPHRPTVTTPVPEPVPCPKCNGFGQGHLCQMAVA